VGVLVQWTLVAKINKKEKFIRISALNLLDGIPELLHKYFWDICKDGESFKAGGVPDEINDYLKRLFILWHSGFQSSKSVVIQDTLSAPKLKPATSKSKLKGASSLTLEEQEAADIMQALKESKKTSIRQPGIVGLNEGTGIKPRFLVILEWGDEQDSEYSDDDNDDFDKDDQDGDADDEGDEHISDTQDADDEDVKIVSDEDDIYKYKIRVCKDDDEEMINAKVDDFDKDLIQKYSLQKIPQVPKNQTPTVDLVQGSEKSASETLQIKREQAEKKQKLKFIVKSTDKASLEEYDLKSALYQSMHVNKSFNRN
nr:hypothetical protein [Tanacetum cinerariifolium]